MIETLKLDSGLIIFVLTIVFIAGTYIVTIKKTEANQDKLADKLTNKMENIEYTLTSIKIDNATISNDVKLLHAQNDKQDRHNQKIEHDLAGIRANYAVLVEGRLAVLEKTLEKKLG